LVRKKIDQNHRKKEKEKMMKKCSEKKNVGKKKIFEKK
jgi:hypothetical protein